MASRKLGKGLNSLLSAHHASEGGEMGAPLWLGIEQLTANSQQPRQNLEKGLDRLAESIRRHGIMQPIIVTQKPDGQYQILAGERRWRASQLAGLKKVPVIVRAAVRSEAERLELALIENIQREDLDPIERALACHRLIKEHGLTQEQVAERLGYERSTVANLVRLLELPGPIQEAVSRETISAGHARALLRLNGLESQEAVFQQVLHDGLSVRAAEATCKRVATGGGAVRHQARPKKPAWALEFQEKLQRRLGVKSELTLRRNGGGRLVLHFSTMDDLDALSQRLELEDESSELLQG